MIVSFSSVNWAEQPVLVLKNLDGTFIQPLTNAFNVEAKLYYNETSELSFDLPAFANGVATPHYEDVVGMRLVDWIGVGQFILVNPSVENNGYSEIKACKAYSLEYELTYKSTYIKEGTYEFWNPMAPAGTVLGMILSDYPSWSVGTVDTDLVGRYRTFESDNQKSYDLMKNTLQDMYQCIFDFDTYGRKINVRSVASQTRERPVYLSTDNLIKKIQVEEDTENIFTVLDVNGADDVDIRSVNPLGTNKIYNLDYFMNTSYFPQAMIDKWQEWKTVYEDAQKQYYNITVEKVLEEAALAAAKAALMELKNELSKYETLQSTYVEASAQGIDRSSELADIKSKISAQERKIADKEEEIASIQETIDSGLAQQQEINAECAFKNFFTSAELTTLDRYFKQDAISESSFVYKKVSSYADPDIGSTVPSVSIALTGAKISGAKLQSGRLVYSAIGGNLEVATGDIKVSAKVVRSTLEQKGDGKFIYSAYLNKGSYNDVSFESAGITVAGTSITVSTDVKQDEEVGGEHYVEGTYFTANCGESSFFFTRNCSEYEKRSIEWDLLEYGQQELTDLCWPSYSFSVDVGNFLALEDFVAFKNQFALGDKIYINLGDKILTPIAIGVEVNFEQLSDFKLLFGDKYSLKDSAFKLVDLLEESIKMGKSTASSKVSYSSFIDSGASTYVKDFMDSALDAAKNAVLAGANQEIKIEESGIRLRSYDKDSGTYGDEQIWMINNTIAFTDDNWSSAKMAIGKIFDNNLARYEKTKDAVRDESKTYYIDTGGTEWAPDGETAWSPELYEKVHEGSGYGIAAPYLVGTILAGANLIIESAKKDGTTAVFRVDADGARMYNSIFDLVKDYSDGGTNANGVISLNPGVGFVGGKDTSSNPLFSHDNDGNVNGVYTSNGSIMNDLTTFNKDDLPNPNFWIDMLGNAYFKGTIYATDGVFSGALKAATGTFSGELKAASGEFSGTVRASKFIGTMDVSDGELIGPAIYVPSKESPNFSVDSSGNVTIRGGNISFSALDQSTQDTINDKVDAGTVDSMIDAKMPTLPEYIKSTYIDFSQVATPTLIANYVRTLGQFQVGYGSKDAFSPIGYMGEAIGSEGIYGGGSRTTYGIAMSTSSGSIDTTTNANYVIVTDAGVRMSSGTQNNGAALYVTSGGAYVQQPGQAAQKIGSGKAVFG